MSLKIYPESCCSGLSACQAPRSTDLPRDWEFRPMAKPLILNLDALPLRAHRRLGPTGRMLAKLDGMRSKFFGMTHFRKNASASPFVSHTFKTKDLKPFRFTHLQKKGGGYPWFLLNAASRSDHSHQSRITSHESRSEWTAMHKAVVNVLGRALECCGRSVLPL